MALHDHQLKPQPVEKFKCSSITASIWKNEGGELVNHNLLESLTMNNG